MIVEILAAASAGYQMLATLACLSFRMGAGRSEHKSAGISVLKPVHGVDSALREAIRSHTMLEGEYELLCGVRPNDPAAKLIAEFPDAKMVECTTVTPNGKVGSLIDLARAARYPILVVNDADIRVEPDYLARVTEPLSDPTVGLVTCMFRPEGDTAASRFEALGVATDLVPSMIVARALGVKDFASGATMAFRRTDLDRIGGFESIANYLADDYQLGHRIHGLGLKCVLSDTIVATHLEATGGMYGPIRFAGLAPFACRNFGATRDSRYRLRPCGHSRWPQWATGLGLGHYWLCEWRWGRREAGSYCAVGMYCGCGC